MHQKLFLMPVLAAAAAGLLTFGVAEQTAEACGCLSPPVPEFDDSEYAVNQQAEQIVFEVEDDGYVTAHVLIRYNGRPESFAWLVPTPTVPDLALSSDTVFGLLEGETAPDVTITQPTLCPNPEYVCDYHDTPSCPFPDQNNASANNTVDNQSGNNAPNGADAGAGEMAPPVEVIKREQIGSYDTVVFTAAEADLAIGWLNDNGFIVNDTMTPFMQPYLDAGMVFVASKLIAGAGVDQIKPLKMRYESTKPMVPLQLTAVAAEPHLTVTSYIVSNDTYFEPEDRPVIGVDPNLISTDQTGRTNYPMVLARLIDDAGGDAFAIEYTGPVPEPQFDDCCLGEGDFCGVGFDGICQCPLSEFDADDCGGENEDLQAGYDLLQELGMNYTHLTRLTTRLSAHEMDFDPVFRPAPDLETRGRLTLQGQRRQMFGCEDDIIDREMYDSIERLVSCATTYCGNGICAVNSDGLAGCSCEQGYVARQFTDLDGVPSVTCVPDVHTVDLAAGGLDLPGACKPSTCGTGSCLDVGGFATCSCGQNGVAVAQDEGIVPSCDPLVAFAPDAGARDYTQPLEDVRACAPAPPTDCGDWGWLTPNQNIQRQGVVCETSLPASQDLLQKPPKPTCDDLYPGYSDMFDGDPTVDADLDGNPDDLEDKEVRGGCAGCTSAAGGPAAGGFLGLLVLGLIRLRRRR